MEMKSSRVSSKKGKENKRMKKMVAVKRKREELEKKEIRKWEGLLSDKLNRYKNKRASEMLRDLV